MPLIGFIIGLAAGALTGSMLGAFSIGVLGALFGTGWLAVSWIRNHVGDAPTIERHRVLCTPYGRAATLELEGDLGTKRWSDVKRCSLLGEDAEVDCDKGCLRQIRLSGVAPGDPCDCSP